MAIHILFISLYAILGSVITGTEIYFILCLHMAVYIVDSLRRKELVSPITLFALGVIIVNLGNISLLDELYTGKITTYSYIVPKYVNEAAQIWAVSCALIIMGFNLASKRTLPPISFDIKPAHLKLIFAFLFIINLLIAFKPSLNIKRNLPVFVLLNTFGILFYARLWASKKSSVYARFTIALLLVETYIALASSFLRSEVIYPLVSLFIGYFIGKKDVKILFSYRILPFVIIGFFYATVFSALDAKRSNFLAYFTEDTKTNPYAVTPPEEENKKDAVLIRSANAAQLTNVVNLVKLNGFYNGRASTPLVVALIPRVLWPDKPKIQLGAWFALEIGQASLTQFGTANNSINMTVMGEMYLDFGWIGVLLGSLLLGALVALLWNSTNFYESEYNLIGTLFGGYLLLIMLIGVAADLQIVITFFSFYVTFYIIKLIAKSIYLKAQ